MRITALLLSIALAVPAAADHVRPFPDPSKILVPPAQFDPRVRGYPKATVYYIDHARMYAVCSNNGANTNVGQSVLACAMPKRRKIYLPIGMTIALRNAVLRHERGHVWGWRHVNTTGGDVQALHEDDHLRHGGEE